MSDIQVSESDRNMQALIVLALVGIAAASQYNYYGRYAGKCRNDGIYYKDESSFVLCSNGNSYVQPCAPGSKNGAYGSYSYGKSYGYADFCGVNLVDYGYAAKNQGYGYNKPSYGYDRPAYGYDRPAYGYDKPAYGYNGPAYGYEAPRYGGYGYDAPGYGYDKPSYGGSYEKREYTSYDAPNRGYGYDNNKGYERVEVKKVSYGEDRRH